MGFTVSRAPGDAVVILAPAPGDCRLVPVGDWRFMSEMVTVGFASGDVEGRNVAAGADADKSDVEGRNSDIF